jgi:hypothetical protein
MGIINEKVLAVAIIGILYAITWLMKPQTILKVIINTVLGIVTIIWALDFFGLFSLSEIIPVNFYS